MWNKHSPVATVSGGTQDSQFRHRDQHGTFPHFPSDHTPLLVRPHVHSSRGHLRWPHDPLQVTQQALPCPAQSEQSAPSSAQISALRTGRTQSPDAHWGIQTGINWDTLNILGLWTNTNHLKGNLWSEGTKHGYAKRLINETWSLDWAPLRGEKLLPTLFLSQPY